LALNQQRLVRAPAIIDAILATLLVIPKVSGRARETTTRVF